MKYFKIRNRRFLVVPLKGSIDRFSGGKKLILITIPRSSAAVGTGQSNIFKRVYTFYIDGRIKACKPLCV